MVSAAFWTISCVFSCSGIIQNSGETPEILNLSIKIRRKCWVLASLIIHIQRHLLPLWISGLISQSSCSWTKKEEQVFLKLTTTDSTGGAQVRGGYQCGIITNLSFVFTLLHNCNRKTFVLPPSNKTYHFSETESKTSTYFGVFHQHITRFNLELLYNTWIIH